MNRPWLRWLLVATLLLIGALGLQTARVLNSERAGLMRSGSLSAVVAGASVSSSPVSTTSPSPSSATEQNLRASLDARFRGATLTRVGERFQVSLESVSLDQLFTQIWSWEQTSAFVVRSLDASHIKAGAARIELQLSPRLEGGSPPVGAPTSPLPKSSP